MRILYVTSRPPWPIRRGDQVRAAGLIGELARRDHVRVVCLRPAGFPACSWPAGLAGREVRLSVLRSLLGVLTQPRLPLQVAMHRHPGLLQVVRSEVATFRPDAAVVVLSRLGQVLEALPSVPALLDVVDSLRLNLANRAVREPALRLPIGWEARRIGAWERSMVASFAHSIVVSERDRADLCTGHPELAPRLSVVPCAVAVDEEPPPPPDRGHIVILTGNLGYFPTRDGALWFAREVWPTLRRLDPRVEWWLAGSRPPRALRELAALPGVRVIADPEDLGETIREATVVVAPLLAGSGTPNKVLEAMTAGRPVVTTPVAAAGLVPLPPGALLVAREPRQFAESVSSLLAEPDTARKQALVAWSFVRERHSLPAVARQLESLLETIATPRRPEASHHTGPVFAPKVE